MSTISHKLPDFPYFPSTAALRPLTSPLSSSLFVTTIVSSLESSQEHTDPHQTLSAHTAEPSSPQAPPSLLQSSPHAPSRADSSDHPIKPARLQSSKCPPSRSSPPPFQTGPENFTPPPRRRSAWRRCKRMGNRLVTPLRSMGLCVTTCTGGRRAMAFCEDASPGSSWYSSGDEYPPDFIRALLENNALFGQPTEND